MSKPTKESPPEFETSEDGSALELAPLTGINIGVSPGAEYVAVLLQWPAEQDGSGKDRVQLALTAEQAGQIGWELVSAAEGMGKRKQ